MNRTRRKKLFSWFYILLMLSFAMGFILYALKQNINLFFTPSELTKAHITAGQVIRLGGIVAEHSVHYTASGKQIYFVVTDHHQQVSIQYQGVLPTLFREGQGVVMTGRFNAEHQFIADQVLAKHDEKYMPAILTKTLKG